MEAPSYHVRIGGEHHGPVPLSTLQHWAATGAMNGEAEIAESAEGPWRSAATLPELEMDWQVIDPEGGRFYPCHVLALRGEVEEGRVDPFWKVENLMTGETYQVVDALCSALLIQTRILEEQLSRERYNAQAATTPEIELLRQRDHFEREAARWKRLYDDEVERNRQREQELQQQNDELRGWQRKASERIKALERRRTQLEEIALRPISGGAPAGADPDLRNAYEELKVQLDRVLESLDLRTRQLEDARQRVLELERLLAQERGERSAAKEAADQLYGETLQHLARLEQAHADLTRSYRHLNDKLIRLRNQVDEPEHTGLHRQTAPSPSPAAAKETSAPPTAPAPGRVKIKLT